MSSGATRRDSWPPLVDGAYSNPRYLSIMACDKGTGPDLGRGRVRAGALRVRCQLVQCPGDEGSGGAGDEAGDGGEGELAAPCLVAGLRGHGCSRWRLEAGGAGRVSHRTPLTKPRSSAVRHRVGRKPNRSVLGGPRVISVNSHRSMALYAGSVVFGEVPPNR